MIVANAVAGFPTTTDRLIGKTAAASVRPIGDVSTLTASARPDPKLASNPAAPRSRAVALRAPARACGLVPGPMRCSAMAATAAAWGAAADVPKNGLKPGRLVATPSTAFRSGLVRVCGSGNRMVTGPAELKSSTMLGLLAGDADTARTSGTALWPTTLP